MINKVIIGLCLIPFVAVSWAQEIPSKPPVHAIKKDKWEPLKRWNFIDPKTGLRTGGYIKRDKWEPAKRWNIYDSNGKEIGIIERDDWESDRYNVIGDFDGGIGEAP